jgi:hypothetical protein
MDPKESINAIVALAGTLRNDQYGTVDYVVTAGALAEKCQALWQHVNRGGYLPGGIMPWDGGNDYRVRVLYCAVNEACDEEDELRAFANGVRLAELVTMVNVDHLI